MKRPFLAPVGWCAGGILCGWYLQVPLSLLWVTAVILLITASRCLDRRWWIPTLCILFGWINTTARTQVISPSDLRLRVGNSPMLGRIHGEIKQRPVVSRPTKNNSNPARWRTIIAVNSIETDGNIWPAFGDLIVFSEGTWHERLSSGMQASVFGVIERPPPAKAPDIFDYREKLRREGIHHQLVTARESDWNLVGGPGSFSWPDRFQDWARERSASGLDGEDTSLQLLWAMVLGWRTALTDEVAEPFMQSGTMHVFAISGLHIAMIAGVLVMLFRLLQLPRHICGLLTIPLLWFYCEATGMQASATRATVMMTIIVIGWTLKRPIDLLNSVCAAAFIILAWEPRQLLQASFQLSFSVVTTIALVLPRFDALKERLFLGDPLLPDELTPWWRKKLINAGRWCYTALALSLAAWLGSAPLIAYYFNLFTPGCLIANPFVVTCAMLGICSAVGGILTSWCPLLPELFNHSAWWWITCQTTISQWVADMPGSWWQIPTPKFAELLVYYLILIGAALRWFRRRWFVATTIVLIIAISGLRIRDSGCIEITVFGHNANSVLIDMPGSQHDLLLDCGRNEGFRSVIQPYLDRAGIDKIPSFVLSHGDINHIEAFPEAISRFKPSRIYASPVRQRSPTYRSAMQTIEPARMHKIEAGDQIGDWKVLFPPSGRLSATADNAALVFHADLRGTKILLLSDLGEIGQRELLKAGFKLDSNILIAGAPNGILLPELLAEITPELVILQDNRQPVSEHISRQNVRWIQQHTKRIIRTSNNGSVRLRLLRLGADRQVVLQE